MEIRVAQPEDYPAIDALVETAFETAEISSGTEHDFVRTMRSGATFLPELEYVAQENGRLLGHIMLTEQSVCLERMVRQGEEKVPEDVELKCVLVAPLCVELEHRNAGIGGMLLHDACEKAAEKGYEAAFLVGNPKYYGKFGFTKTIDFGICNNSGILNDVVLCRELKRGALKNVRGMIHIV